MDMLIYASFHHIYATPGVESRIKPVASWNICTAYLHKIP
ncbi:Hypothetical protein ETEE_0595 [Edwardsiella anguillarum ET080813]|uniref:Uncharacterized protein n=1 Tax=Edwardsiella anguillarum ET080813 TaxID=667120 RepID=A0A076LKA6_9GAMM|nr:Hypothetical protein ETEE_0595 [Edwardsiella anguillarum ET080813]